MARINVEDSIWRDPRFLDLAIRLGSMDTAIGVLVRAWDLAQRNYKSPGRCIPKTAWAAARLPDAIIECGLARWTDSGVHVCGSTEAFNYIKVRQELGAASHVKPLKKSPRKRSQTVANAASSSSSSSFSSSDSGSNPPEGIAPLAEVGSPVGYFIAAYARAYDRKYTRDGKKARPSLGGKVQGQIRRFVEETPIERACALIETYLSMNDQWFLTKAHDFGTFLENLSKIGLKLDTGSAPTRAEARQAEVKQGIIDVWGPLIAEAERKEREGA